MKTPKMMAACVTAKNYDVIAAIVPEHIFGYRAKTPVQLYGMFVVINIPIYATDERGGRIELANDLMSEEAFAERFTVPKKTAIFDGEFFQTSKRQFIRHVVTYNRPN